jgi:hypothetical protein
VFYRWYLKITQPLFCKYPSAEDRIIIAARLLLLHPALLKITMFWYPQEFPPHKGRKYVITDFAPAEATPTTGVSKIIGLPRSAAQRTTATNMPDSTISLLTVKADIKQGLTWETAAPTPWQRL